MPGGPAWRSNEDWARTPWDKDDRWRREQAERERQRELAAFRGLQDKWAIMEAGAALGGLAVAAMPCRPAALPRGPRMVQQPPGPRRAPHYSGTSKPWLAGATPHSRYTHIGPDGKAVQNAIYDANGNVIGHVDFKNHGPGAPSGHGHQFPIPGKPASGHGHGMPHIPPDQLPPGWGDLPPDVPPRTPIGQ